MFYANEDNAKRNENPTNFFLHRLKKNVKIKFTNSLAGISFFNVGIELLDISVPTKLDYIHQDLNKIVDFEKNNQDSIKDFRYEDIKITLYTITGLIHDYIKILFLIPEYPWIDKKYFKRLDRFIILLTMHNIDNLSEFKNFSEYFSKGSKNCTDKFNKEIIEYIDDIERKIDSLGDEEKKKQKEMFMIFKKTLNDVFIEILKNIDQKTFLGTVHRSNLQQEEAYDDFLTYMYLKKNKDQMIKLNKLVNYLKDYKDNHSSMILIFNVDNETVKKN